MPKYHQIPSQLVQKLRAAKRIVVFTGAGVSAESGIPTFRDALTGLWSQFEAEDLATRAAFQRNRALVWGWYEWRRSRVMVAQPNPAHRAIAAMAAHVPELIVITQNVDDLHERAGSAAVCHLHGSLFKPYCLACGRPHQFSSAIPDEPDGGRLLEPPRCAHCNGFVRPGVVWFGESLPVIEFGFASRVIKDCEVFFSIGTSSLVYPAADLPAAAAGHGAMVVQVNPHPTALDSTSRYNLRSSAADVMPAILEATWGVVLPAAASGVLANGTFRIHALSP